MLEAERIRRSQVCSFEVQEHAKRTEFSRYLMRLRSRKSGVFLHTTKIVIKSEERLNTIEGEITGSDL